MAQNTDNFRQLYPLGTKLPEASAKNFIGQAYIAPITVNRELNVPMSNVTFEPRCRNNWHYHKGGQILVASAGIGYYQEKGKPARRLYPGDIVEIAPDVIHWHGAAPDSWFAHVAVSCNPQTNEAVWLSPVGEKEYQEATSQAENVYAEANRVLEAREQAIVSIAAYTGKGDLAHLRQALVKGLESGMTVNEVNEVLNMPMLIVDFLAA